MERTVDMFHLDDNEVIFFKRQLEYVKAKTYDIILKDLKGLTFVPISTEIPEGYTEVTWRSFTSYGLAKIIADYARDFPRADVGGTENHGIIKDIGSSYGYTTKEIKRAAITGFDLETRRAAAARRANDEKVNSIALTGDTTNNLNGLLNYPDMPEYTVPSTGTGVTKTWSTKTADNILVDLNGIVDQVSVTTAGKERVTMILVPLTQYNLLKNTRIDSYNTKSILQFFKENNPDIGIDWCTELAGAGDSGTDRFMAYVKDEMHLTLELPVAFTQLEPQQEMMEYKIPCYSSCGGVIVYYPLSMCYGDGI